MATEPPVLWRVGTQVPINVYAGNVPVCQCQTAEYARQIVRAVNTEIRTASRIGSVDTSALLRVSRVATLLDISRPSVYDLIQKGELNAVHVGSRIRVPQKSVNELIARGK